MTEIEHELRKRRLDNLRRFADKNEHYSDILDACVGLGKWEFDGTGQDEPFDHRYLVLFYTFENEEEYGLVYEDYSTSPCQTLRDVARVISANVFDREFFGEDSLGQYDGKRVHAAVVDLDSGEEVKWEERREVIFV